MLLTIWMDRINEERKNVQEAFDKLKFFVDNMRPAPELSDSTKQNIERLVTSAFQCHLDKTAEQVIECDGIGECFTTIKFAFFFDRNPRINGKSKCFV